MKGPYLYLKSTFNHLGYPSSLVNGIIDKCDYPSTLDAKTKIEEAFKIQFSVQRSSLSDTVKRQMRDLSAKNRY